MEDMVLIRKVMKNDFEKGFLDTLSNLRASGLTPKQALKIFQELEKNPVYNFLVADLAGRIVGVATLLIEKKFIHKGGYVGHIENVSVKKEFERQRIGKLLINFAVKESINRGCYKVILNCSERNVVFYEKCGFQRHGIEMRIDVQKDK